MTVTFTLGSIKADGGEIITRTKHGWGLQDLDGWSSLSSSKSEAVDRPQAHGAFDTGIDWREPAAFTATLAWIGDSIADLDDAVHRLTGLAGTGGIVVCTFDDGSTRTSRKVSIRKIDVPPHRGKARLTGIEVDLLAPDPFAYGDPISVSTGLPVPGGGMIFPVLFPTDFGKASANGRVIFTNIGTAQTPIRFKVTGELSDGFQIRRVESGEQLTFARPLAVDDYVLLDSSDGSVLLNGTSSVSGYLIDDNWWQVGPGETCTVQFAALGGQSGEPTLTLTASPAYF